MTAPNLREAKCCGTCRHFDDSLNVYSSYGECMKHLLCEARGKYPKVGTTVARETICDDYTPREEKKL